MMKRSTQISWGLILLGLWFLGNMVMVEALKEEKIWGYGGGRMARQLEHKHIGEGVSRFEVIVGGGFEGGLGYGPGSDVFGHGGYGNEPGGTGVGGQGGGSGSGSGGGGGNSGVGSGSGWPGNGSGGRGEGDSPVDGPQWPGTGNGSGGEGGGGGGGGAGYGVGSDWPGGGGRSGSGPGDASAGGGGYGHKGYSSMPKLGKRG